ncbi:MAG: HAD family phosphatase [Reyranellaceae bacterium]
MAAIVVFDLGGVLLDWNPRHLYRKLLPDAGEMEEFLATVTTTEWHAGQDRGGDPVQATQFLKAQHPGKEALIDAFYSRFGDMLEICFPDMAALVERLHEAGTPLYLLSNAPAFLDPWLRGPGRRRHPFLGCFRDYVVSGQVGYLKPAAAIYDLVCRTGDFSPGDAVLVDDSLPNVEGARAFGMKAIHHRTADDTITRLRTFGLPA